MLSPKPEYFGSPLQTTNNQGISIILPTNKIAFIVLHTYKLYLNKIHMEEGFTGEKKNLNLQQNKLECSSPNNLKHILLQMNIYIGQ